MQFKSNWTTASYHVRERGARFSPALASLTKLWSKVKTKRSDSNYHWIAIAGPSKIQPSPAVLIKMSQLINSSFKVLGVWLLLKVVSLCVCVCVFARGESNAIIVTNWNTASPRRVQRWDRSSRRDNLRRCAIMNVDWALAHINIHSINAARFLTQPSDGREKAKRNETKNISPFNFWLPIHLCLWQD